MTSRQTIAAAGVAAVAALVLAAVPFGGGEAAPATAEATPTAASRDGQVLALRGEIAQLRREVRQREVAAMPVAAAAADGEAGDGLHPMLDREQVRDNERVVVAAIRNQLDDVMAGEPTDPTWAAETEAGVRNTLATPRYAALALDRVECRSTMCRLQLSTPEDPSRTEELIAELTTEAPFSSGGFVSIGVDGAPTAMYVARAGHELPPPPHAGAR